MAIGDIHGAIGHLRRLLRRLRVQPDDLLIFLGDYVDRGENSRAVLDRLMRLEQEHQCIFLRGNHEEMLLAAADGGVDEWESWLVNGGATTIHDFGGSLPGPPYLSWLRTLRMFYETDTHYFVHAGLRPDVPAQRSTDSERLWIREPFISSAYDWGKCVVFGHTVQLQGPLVLPNKIGIDTGACLPGLGKLTALVLPDNIFEFSTGSTRTVQGLTRLR